MNDPIRRLDRESRRLVCVIKQLTERCQIDDAEFSEDEDFAQIEILGFVSALSLLRLSLELAIRCAKDAGSYEVDALLLQLLASGLIDRIDVVSEQTLGQSIVVTAEQTRLLKPAVMDWANRIISAEPIAVAAKELGERCRSGESLFTE